MKQQGRRDDVSRFIRTVCALLVEPPLLPRGKASAVIFGDSVFVSDQYPDSFKLELNEWSILTEGIVETLDSHMCRESC